MGPAPDARYLAVALGLILVFMVFEVLGAVIAGSLALLADAGHMLTDAVALGASLWAARLATRPATGTWTFGLKRAEILSAAGNGLALVVVSALLAFEAVRHLIHPAAVEGSIVVGLAAVGLAVNVVVVWVLRRASRSSLNIQGCFRHVLTDAYGFAATVAAGALIVATGFERADAIASLVVVALMLGAATSLLRDSGRVLLEGSPLGVDLDEVRLHLLETEHVSDVHDLHAWTVTSALPALSAHVVLQDSCFYDGHAARILDQLQSCLADHFDVEHSTFQLEAAGHLDHEPGTH
ncbi:MAG: cation diffusion facilitator family transporter [Acidimicrobiales bacterium]